MTPIKVTLTIEVDGDAYNAEYQETHSREEIGTIAAHDLREMMTEKLEKHHSHMYTVTDSVSSD